MEIIKRLQELDQNDNQDDLFGDVGLDSSFSRIKLSQFYGIELDDFAHEVAILSLWLAEHQMNVEFKAEFGECEPTLPLQNGGKIISGNAVLIDWSEVCPISDNDETYLIGNPPYLGAKNQNSQHKTDIKQLFSNISKAKNIDYIACWFYKASRYLKAQTQCAFVTTNSVCQGTQVPLIWPLVLTDGIEFGFAIKDFHWSNNAKNKAGVTCSILGIRRKSSKPKYIYSNTLKRLVKNINPYLIDSENIIVEKNTSSICGLPKMQNGNQPYDGGFLIFTEDEKRDFVEKSPESKRFFKKLVGSVEFIRGTHRWCLWIGKMRLSPRCEIIAV